MAVRAGQSGSEAGMREYVLEQTAARLGRFAYQVARSAQLLDADAIHDLRVSIRRFSQCLRAFAAFLPKGKPKKVRRYLKAVMDLAAEVRNQDIALALLARAGVLPGATVMQSLRRRRAQGQAALLAALKQWTRRDLSRKWRAQLEL